MKIFIATKNQKKLKELKRILIPMGFDVLCESDLDFAFKDAVEDGETFAENALIKAKSGLEQTGYITVADDSGLCVDYLNGDPGIYSARYAGKHGDSDMNNDKLLAELQDVPMEKRTAHFTCVVACVFPDSRQFTVSGDCYGHIAFERQTGNGGFGYDPLFISEKGPFSQLTDDEKDEISHRGKALKKFKEELKKYIED